MSKLQEIRKPVEMEMKHFQKHFKTSIKSDVSLLNLVTAYVLKTKGKQMRPLFVFLTAKLVGEITESTYTAASLIELMHTATLIHDDVVDESYERRSKFSINAIWRSKLSVLLGDFFLAKGLNLAVENNDHALLNILTDTVIKMSEGELLQLQKSRNLNIDIESYYEVISKKTATLIASCTAGGAMSAGASREETDRLYEMGINIGMAFQIKDDLFDYQSRGTIGKPTANDIKDKKFTLPLIYALQQSKNNEKRRILKLFRNGSISNRKIEEIISFVKSNHGLVFAEKTMNEYKDKALSTLNSYDSSPARDSLIELVRYSVERKK